MIRNIELILNGVKYQFCCTRNGQKRFSIAPSASPEKCVYANIRPLSDGGYLTEIFGKSHVAYITNRGDSAIGMRMTINGVSISFSTDYDPTSLKTDVAGKLVKKLVADGEHVKKGQAYCEVEVMKMFMPLKVSEAGIITWRNNEGASLSPGDQLATLELDNPENVETVSIFSGDLQPIGQIDRINSTKDSSSLIMGKLRPHLSLRKAFENLDGAMAGFLLSKNSIQQAIEDILVTVTDPHLPVYEIEEHLSVISNRIDPKLLDDIQKLILNHQVQITKIADKSGFSDSSATQSFPAQELLDLINNHIAQVSDVAERNSLKALTTPLLDVAKLYTSPRGSERALQGFLNILRRWIDVERWFCDNLSYADAVDNLRKSNKNNYDHVLEVCRAHSGLKSNVEIVYYIMDSISDALKMGTGTMDPHLTLKKSNILAGAESLQDAMPLLNLIGSMGGNSVYCAVALRARKLLLQESLSSIEERKLRITRMISILSDHSENTDTSCELDSFINENVPLSDFLYPLMNYFTNENEKLALLELHMRKLYRTQTLKDVHRNTETSTLKFTFVSKSSETVFSLTTPVTSMTDLTRAISKSSSMNRLGELSDSESEGNLLRLSHGDSVPPYTQRTAVCRLFGSLDELTEISCFEDLLASFPQYKKIAPKCTSGPANVLYIICMNPTYSRATMVVDELAISVQQLLVQWHYNLEQADVRRVSFVFNPSSDDIVDSYQQPIILTYRAAFDYKEDTLFRNIDPSHAYQFDLNRLEKNFRVESIGQRQTARCYIHSYKASPRTTALAKDKTANKDSRIFVRALSFTSEFSSISFEKVLVDALIALDIAVHENGSSTDNHLFLNLISACDETVLDPAIVEQSIVDILKRYSARIVALGLTEVETKLLCRLTEDSPPIALRMFASNPTGYVLVMNTYVEAVTPSATTPIFKLVGGTKASLSSSGDSSWEGLKVTSPYPLTRPFDAQRKSALLASDSLYCYDIPALFEAAIEQQWSDAATKGGIEGSIRAAARPLMVMFTSELVVKKKNDPGSPWTFQDYLSGGLELIQTQRRAGANDVGMVAWLMTLKTVEYPEVSHNVSFYYSIIGFHTNITFSIVGSASCSNC
jgi:acetyl-CoA carboxylase/biotin carboxylase 1